jgi:hypothetical protein
MFPSNAPDTFRDNKADSDGHSDMVRDEPKQPDLLPFCPSARCIAQLALAEGDKVRFGDKETGIGL